MSTATLLQGKSTFAFDDAIRRVRQYLQKTSREHQIEHIPETYPQQLSEISGIGIVPRTKILKAHLEDVFRNGRFSVSVIHNKTPVIKIIHDTVESETIESIATLYANSESIHIERFRQ